MANRPKAKLEKLAPDANLLTIKGFGDILFSSPSDIIKPLLRRDKYPDYCVLPLRTLNFGHNLLDVEFLYYLAVFIRKDQGKVRFVCEPQQQNRIISILSESIFGPSFRDLMLSMIPRKCLRTPRQTTVIIGHNSIANPESEARKEAMENLLARLARHTELNEAFDAAMDKHLPTEKVVRRIVRIFPNMREIKPNFRAKIARAWAYSMLMRRECGFFGAYPQNPKEELKKNIEFTLFSKDGEAVLKKDRKTVRIQQDAPSVFAVYSGRQKVHLIDMSMPESPPPLEQQTKRPFSPPDFGITFIGSGSGFATEKLSTCSLVWIEGRGMAIDMIANPHLHMRRLGMSPSDIQHVLLTHAHSDHDGGLVQRILASEKICLLSSRTVFESFLRKAAAISCMTIGDFAKMVDFVELVPGKTTRVPGLENTEVSFDYSFHPIPAGRAIIKYSPPGKEPVSIAFSGDTLYDPEVLDGAMTQSVITPDRCEALKGFLWDADIIVHEAGGRGIHTDIATLAKLPQDVRKKLYLNHTGVAKGRFKGMRFAEEGKTLHLVKASQRNPRDRRINVLRSTGLFAHLSPRELEKLYDSGKVKRIASGDEIVREGEPGDVFYIILDGVATVLKSGLCVNDYEKGNFFGELAIVSGEHIRKATVMAQSNVEVFCINSELYNKYNLPQAAEENLHNLVNFFSRTATPAMLRCLSQGQIRQFSRGDDIILLGATDRAAYVLLSGSVEVLDKDEKQLAEISDMDVFGEIASMEKVNRTATVRAKSHDVKVLKLNESNFCELIKRFPSFHATMLQKKRKRMKTRQTLQRIMEDKFGFK